MRRVLLTSVIAFTACATKPGPYQQTPIVWHDDDRHLIDEPKPYVSPLYWDGADQTLFAPISRALSVQVAPPARNVNALGEVPNSSWFQNRIGQFDIPPERIARAACASNDPITPQGPWVVRSGKIEGGTPGFVIQDMVTKKTYMLKFDDPSQPERQTAADVVGSKVYWAFGMNVPCNSIVEFDASIVRLTSDATKLSRTGTKVPLTQQDLDDTLQHAVHTADGRVRGIASQFVPGTPLGPWRFEGVSHDDHNDVVSHQDRREVRGSRLVAAWVNHYDSREENTLATFHKVQGDKGFVTHWLIDFGDSLGALFPYDDMSRRMGYSYYFDFADITGDMLALGIPTHPWDKTQHHHNDTAIFGYFDVENFSPTDCKPGYPNLAFERMDELDGYWAAQIISRVSNEAIAAIVATAHFADPQHARMLESILIGRRNRIVHDYMYPMTSLERPVIRDSTLCFEDALIAGKYATTERATYEMSTHPLGEEAIEWRRFEIDADGKGCVPLTGQSVIEARVRRTPDSDPARAVVFHIAHGEGGFELIGVER